MGNTGVWYKSVESNTGSPIFEQELKVFHSMRFVIATGLEKKPGALIPTSKQKAENVKRQLFIYFCFVSKLCPFWGKTGKTSPSGALVH